MANRAGFTSLMVALALTMGCAGMSEVQKGAAIGGAAGVAGGLVYEAFIEGPSAVDAAVVGGLGGGLIGALVGDHNQEAFAIQEYEKKLADLTKEKDAESEKLRKCLAEGQARGQDITNLKNKIAELERQIAALRDELNKCKGSRVEMSIENDVLFGSGKAVLTDRGRKALDEAAAKIKDAHSDKKVHIEGHTDTDPIKASNWKSNWELGAARALAVLHYLEDKHGIKADTLSASTWGPYRPVASNDSADGKAKNRRSIIVLYTAWPTN